MHMEYEAFVYKWINTDNGKYKKQKGRMFYLEIAMSVFKKSNDPRSIKIYQKLKEEYLERSKKISLD